MNKENLRKVVYQRHGGLNQFEGAFDDEAEMRNVEELLKKRNGWFHQWIEGKNIALVENEDGAIEEIESKWVKFID